MKRLAVSYVLLSVCIATAAAQDQSASRVYVMRAFCTPTVLNDNVYPVRALERQAIGDATIDCALDAAHEPQTCQIVRESSRGWGWGEGALRAACQMSPNAWARASGLNARSYTDSDGVAHVERTVRFHVEGGWRPEDLAQGSARN